MDLFFSAFIRLYIASKDLKLDRFFCLLKFQCILFHQFFPFSNVNIFSYGLLKKGFVNCKKEISYLFSLYADVETCPLRLVIFTIYIVGKADFLLTFLPVLIVQTIHIYIYIYTFRSKKSSSALLVHEKQASQKRCLLNRHSTAGG